MIHLRQVTQSAALCSYAFGPFVLEPGERRLLVGGEPASIGPRAFDVLVALVERAGTLVTKDQLLEAVWPNLVVEESNLHVQVSSLRKVLGTKAITTVQGRGYRFALTPERLASTDRASNPEHNLPRQLTTFIGRHEQLEHIKALLDEAPLLTLTGCGGCGKTRLALRFAQDMVGRRTDGVWVVELAALGSGELLAKAITKVLGMSERPDKPVTEALLEHLRHKHLLLVLDNCEHLRDACARLCESIGRYCPDVQILATSRESLGFAGEQTYRVPSLSFPDAKEGPQTTATLMEHEAIQLFVTRARCVDAHFQLTERNAKQVLSICRQLDGIPLAIELAAARIRTLSAEDIEARLDHRFRLLTCGSRTALPRHRTLRSLIDWSYDLLADQEKRLLQSLSVFAGGWSLAAAEQVCASEGGVDSDVLDVLSSLADKSLVITEKTAVGARYRLLETVREYAGEKLSESGAAGAAHQHHLQHFLAMAVEAEAALMCSEQADWLERLEREHDNIRSALSWSVANQSGAALRLCASLLRFWIARGHFSEGSEWCRQVLAKTTGHTTREQAKALNVAGVLAYYRSDYGVAKAWSEQSLALARVLGDTSIVVDALNNLGATAYDQCDLKEARAFLEECLAIARESNNRASLARALGNLGNIACEQGDLETAVTLIQECLQISAAVGHRAWVAYSLHFLGSVALCSADYEGARAKHIESLGIWRELGDRRGMAGCLEALAATTCSSGNELIAARIWGTAETLREEGRSPLAPNERLQYEHYIRAARAGLADDAAFDAAWAAGRSMTSAEAAVLACTESRQQERPATIQ